MSQRELKGLLEDVPSTSSKPASSSSSSSSSSRASLPSSISSARRDTLVPSQTVAVSPSIPLTSADSLATTSSVSPAPPSSMAVSPGSEMSQLMTMIREMNSSVIMLTSDMSAIKNELHVVKNELSIARSAHNVTETSKNDADDVDSESVSTASSAPSSSSFPPVATSSNDSSPPSTMPPLRPSFTRSDVRSQSSNDRPSSQSQVRPVRKHHRSRDFSSNNRREEERNDQPNEDDISEYASMMDYLRKRERLYPYVNDRFKRLYTGRCTLLSHNGRVNEYFRFGMMVDFNPQLYPPVYSRWFERYLAEAADEYSDIPFIDVNSLYIPSMSFHPQEARLMTRTNDDYDLQPFSLTLQELPRELQQSPSVNSAFHFVPPSIEESAYKYVCTPQFKGKKAGAHSVPTPMKVKTESNTSTVPATPNKVNMFEQLTPEAEGRYFGVPYPKTQAQATADMYTRPEGYLADVKREYDNRVDRDRDTPYHQQLRRNHVLRDVLDSFDEGTRQMCQSTLSDRQIEDKDVPRYITSTIAALEKFNGDPEKAPQWFQSLIINLVKVNFTRADVISIIEARMVGAAKQWLMAALLKIAPVAHTDAAIPTLFGLFREQYMNNTHIVDYRSRLTNMRSTDIFISPSDLREHYTRFTIVANNLKVCDRHTNDDTIKQMYVDSLPRSIRNYLSINYKKCESVDAIFQMAEEACKVNQPKRKVDLENESVKLNVINTYDISDQTDDSDSESADDVILEIDDQYTWVLAQNMRQRRAPIMREDVQCWHCGARGHYAGECEVNVKGLPQTPKGAAVYAAFNRMRGETRPYNAKFYRDNSEQIRLKREKYQDKSVENHRSTRSDGFNDKFRSNRRRVHDNNSGSMSGDTSNSSDVVDVESHIIDLRDDISDEEVDDESKHVVRLSSIDSKYMHSSLEQIQHREQREREAGTATSICLPIEINGVSM